jgi:multidrug efflux system outer membrane protein
MTELRRLLLFIPLLSLGACAVGPDYERPAIESPDRWRFEYQQTSDTANIEWWRQFDDPVLDDLIDTALQENKDVRIAAARVEEFIGRLRTTRSGLFPQFGYDLQGERQRNSELGSVPIPPGVDPINESYSAVINARWEIDLWGKLRRASEAARADLLASEESRRTVILTLVSAVATTYVDLRNFDKQLEIARRTLKSRGDALHIFQLRYDGGVVSELELNQVKSEYEQAAAAVPFQERLIAQTENALSVLLGRNPGPIPRGKSIDELTLPSVPAALPSSLLDQRPDIRVAEQDLIAANARIGVAKARYFPTVSLTGFFGSASAELSDLFSGPAQTWNFGGSITGPIFTGGAISGEVQTATAQQQQLLFSYQRTIQNAFREVEDSLIGHVKFREQLDAQGRRVDALRNYARLAKLRFEGGYTGYLEVLDSERSLFSAELAYAQNQSDVYTSLVDIYKSIGGGWVIEAEKIAEPTTSSTPTEVDGTQTVSN